MSILFQSALRWLVLCALFPLVAVAQTVPSPIKIALIEGLSGPFANTGEAVFRNVLWAVERVNSHGGIRFKGKAASRALVLERYDSKGQTEEALTALKSAIDHGTRFVMQGNSSAIAAALIDAINKHNEREPSKRVVFLNYSAVDPMLTNEKCSFWHFRFDAHADMRMSALMSVIKDDAALKSVYIIGQDYSFGQAVAREARRQLSRKRPDVRIAGDELHAMGRVKDFLPYVTKIKASGAQAVITGNWGNDLTLLIKAAKEIGFDGKFYTFYGNALGVPATIGDAGIGKVVAVADWLPNVSTPQSDAFYQTFRQRFPKPSDDYVIMRMQLMVVALVQAIESAGTIDAIAVATALERSAVTFYSQRGSMRATDHQFLQPLVVGVMDRLGTAGVKLDVEGSGYGFRVIKTIAAQDTQQPTTCKMRRP